MSAGSAEFTLVSLLIHYCFIFHTNSCRPTFAPPRKPLEASSLAPLSFLSAWTPYSTPQLLDSTRAPQ